MLDPTCDHCHQPAATLLRCSKCQCAFYCSQNCQKAAWKSKHKQTCNETATHRQKSCDEAAFRKTLLEKGVEQAEDICAICLDPPQSPVALGCNHVFCGPCLNQLERSNAGVAGKIRNSCPVCRALVKGGDFTEFVYQKAVMFIYRANSLDLSVGVPMTAEDPVYSVTQARIQLYCKLAREEIVKVEGLAEERDVKVMWVDLLLLEGKYEEVISTAVGVLSVNGVDYVSCVVRQVAAKACIRLRKYEQAHRFLVDALAYLHPDDGASIALILSLMSVTRFYDQDYESAIRCANQVLEMNRHGHGCYDYLILSHLALGQKEQ
ncbi:hypothetical protein BDR26DRAFT_963613 [Obelidium mucronatum]|nr:hypothetical protein BDR26DRAFT_963613 [Obelidium mucronatum]